MNKLHNFRRALRASVGKACAYQIGDGHGAAIAPILERAIRGERVHDSELLGALADDDMSSEQWEDVSQKLAAPLIIPAGKGGKATALVSARGVALYDLEFQPFAFSTLLLSQTMGALANDPEIGTVILDIDSPGGVVTGTPEAADAVFAARNGARVVALVNPLAASAAYWIASQTQEIVAVPSADVGSVGVFLLHANCAGLVEQSGVEMTFIHAGEHKVEGNAFEALSEDTRTHLQGEVDKVYRDFLKAAARGRGVPVSKVESDFGQGRTLMARDALKAGMIDRVATINAAMARFGVSQATLSGRRRGEDVQPEPQADDDLPNLASELMGPMLINAEKPPARNPLAEPELEPELEDDTPNTDEIASRARRLALLSKA